MSIGESLHTKSMGCGIRVIDKANRRCIIVSATGFGPCLENSLFDGVVVHIPFLRRWVGRLHYGLSEIVDGKFVKPSTAGRFEFTPILVAHALGATLLDYLDDNSPLDHDTADLDYCSPET